MIKFNYIKYIAVLSLGLVACEPEFDTPLEDAPAAVQQSGEADFSKYVALGNSLTAGFADNALYVDGQNSSFANIIATQMQAAGGGEFKTPLMADNVGGFPDIPTQNERLVFDPSIGERGAPVPIGMGLSTTTLAPVTGPFNNMGVPGARSFHLGAPGYGSAANLATGRANPYFVRMASSPTATVIGDALAQQPTFFSLWIGNNDVLSYATSGGVGVLQPMPTTDDPSMIPPPGRDDISHPLYFREVYKSLINGLTLNTDGSRNNTKGIVATVPDVTTLPFFTTVPNNALVLTAEQAAGLTGFFQVYAGVVSGGIQLKGVPKAQADVLASQYAFKFKTGSNRFLIKVPQAIDNPQGIRQMTEDELLILRIDQNALRTEGYGSARITDEIRAILGKVQTQGPTSLIDADFPKILGAVNAINDKDALDSEEQALLKTSTDAYNETIKSLASAKGIAVYDANERLKTLSTAGIPLEGAVITSQFVLGGFFSLDGIHLTPRGNAMIANEMIDTINEKYDSTLQKVNAGQRGTVTFK